MCGFLSCAPTDDLACNLAMCPDWESNQQLFSSQAGTQSAEPHQAGQEKIFTYDMSDKGLIYKIDKELM